MNRIVGVLTLRAPVYRQIAEDPSATGMAAVIVAVVSLLTGVVSVYVLPGLGIQLPAILGQVSSNPILDVILTVLSALVGWGILSAIIGFVSKLLGGKTNTGAMLRVLGFAWIFNLLGIIPCLGIVIGFVLAIIGAILGIREASGVSTGKSIAIGIIGFIVFVVVAVVLAVVLGFILGPAGLFG